MVVRDVDAMPSFQAQGEATRGEELGQDDAFDAAVAAAGEQHDEVLRDGVGWLVRLGNPIGGNTV